MGCASSKVLGSELAVKKGSSNGLYARGISMPTHIIHNQECPEDFHIVALTSSTYGILKVDPLKPPEDEGKEGMAPQSVKEVLNKLNNLESKADAGPQSWLEVSNMLENLKPGLETTPANNPKAPKFGKASKPSEQLVSIDINEIMMDIDEDTGMLKPKASVVRRASLKKAGNSLPIYTLEELDKRMRGGKENCVKTNQPPVVTDFRALLKPIGTGNAKTDVLGNSLKRSTLKSEDQNPATSPISMPDGIARNDSELFDDNFLESYKTALPTLSDEDWKVLELQEDAESELQHGAQSTEAVGMTRVHAEVMKDQAAVRIPQAEPAQHALLSKEKTLSDEEKAISETNSLSPRSVEVIAKDSPLESYEELCPPGGKHAVVLYTTSLRGIRKTYEDCIRIRDIVQSYGVLIDERDVSMHLEYRNELRELMQRQVTAPRLFINGKYIGGMEKVCKLQEEGLLAGVFEGSMKAYRSQEGACDGCGNARFVPCFECNGSRKVLDEKRQVARCAHCNENGLAQCPICC